MAMGHTNHRRLAAASALAIVAALLLGGCRNPYRPQHPIEHYQSDPAWSQRTLVLLVDTGNRITGNRSESQFSSRRSVVALDGLSSMLQLLSTPTDPGMGLDLEAELEKLGLEVTHVTEGSVPSDPGEFNIVIERAEYIQEHTKYNFSDPLVMDLRTVYYVRVLSPKGRESFKSERVRVRTHAKFEAMPDRDAARYSKEIQAARTQAAGKLVRWLQGHLAATMTPEEE